MYRACITKNNAGLDMTIKNRNARFSFIIGVILLASFSNSAQTEITDENPAHLLQFTSPPGNTVTIIPSSIESAYEILKRSRNKQSVVEEETEPELELEDQPSGEVITRVKLKMAPVKGNVAMGALSTIRIDTTPVRPLELWDIPDDSPEPPAYFVIHAADRDVTGLTYRSTKNTNHVKLFLDTDGDGLVSDEIEYLGRRHPLITVFMTYDFSAVTTQNTEKGISGGMFHVQCTDGEWLTLHPAYCREGQVNLDGRSYRIAVVDGDYDGKYNRVFEPPARGSRTPWCDIIVLDRNRNSEFEFIDSELMPLCRFIKINNKNYDIKVTEDGSEIVFRQANIQYGTLDLGGEKVDLKLWSDAMHMQLKGSDKKWRLPAGKYGISSFKLSEKESEENQMDFKATVSNSGGLSSFEIKPGRTTSMALGPPYKIVTSMDRSGENITLSFLLVGKAGESYLPGAEKDGEMLPEPTFKVFDESGKVVHTGKFEYG